jgi:hypothetical protein
MEQRNKPSRGPYTDRRTAQLTLGNLAGVAAQQSQVLDAPPRQWC